MKSLIRVFLVAITTAIAAPMILDVAAHEDDIKARVPALVTEHMTIASDTPGIQLYIRNKRPQEVAVSADRILLYVHGTTYPAATAFDLRLDGMSWMDYIAAQHAESYWR